MVLEEWLLGCALVLAPLALIVGWIQFRRASRGARAKESATHLFLGLSASSYLFYLLAILSRGFLFGDASGAVREIVIFANCGVALGVPIASMLKRSSARWAIALGGASL